MFNPPRVVIKINKAGNVMFGHHASGFRFDIFGFTVFSRFCGIILFNGGGRAARPTRLLYHARFRFVNRAKKTGKPRAYPLFFIFFIALHLKFHVAFFWQDARGYNIRDQAGDAGAEEQARRNRDNSHERRVYVEILRDAAAHPAYNFALVEFV